jgi:hypothetical protein
MATFVQCTCAWTWGGRRRMRRASVEREEVGCARASSGYGRALGRGCGRISLCAAMTHASAVSCTSSAAEYEDRQAQAAPPLIYRSPMSSAGREGSSARHHERSGGQPRGAPSARSSADRIGAHRPGNTARGVEKDKGDTDKGGTGEGSVKKKMMCGPHE